MKVDGGITTNDTTKVTVLVNGVQKVATAVAPRWLRR